MPKITEENYSIPTIYATEWREVLSTGSTEPMLILGVDSESGERDSFVIKPFGHPRIYEKAIMRECIGAWIGMQLGINVFEPVYINVSTEFAETLRGERHYDRFVNSIGLNFGTRFVPGTIPIIGQKCFSKIQASQAEQVTSFDMLISNADRREEKPNLLMIKSDLFIFDHELAFDFLMMFSFNRNPRPWKLRDFELAMLRKHFLYPKLKGTTVEISDFVESFTLLDNDFWQKVENLLPPNWRSDDLATIQTYLKLIIENRTIFAQQLAQAILT